MTEAAPSLYPWLPPELYTTILVNFARSRHNPGSVHALIRCSETSKAMRAVATNHLMWEGHYHARYTHHDKRVDELRRTKHAGDWYTLYRLRCTYDRHAVRVLDDMEGFVGGATHRHELMTELIELYSFDVWDALARERARPVRLSSIEGAEPEPGSITFTRHWWVTNMLGTMARHQAVTNWLAVETLSLEQALNGLSAYFNRSEQELEAPLDELAAGAGAALADAGVDPASAPPAETCTHLLAFLQAQGYGPAEGQSFTNLFNSFPHHFLAPGAGRRSLPLSLCAVFAALAGRLGLTAHALDVPMRVIARVDSPGHTPVLVDVYAGSVMPPAVLAPEALAPLSPEAARRGPLVLRATRNISHSIGMMMQLGGQGVSPRALHAAHYASLSAACAVGGRAGRDLLEQLAWCVADAPLDARAVVRERIAPRLVPAARDVLNARMDEFQAGEAGTVAHRAGMRRVRWWVGCWFRHRMFGYHAVVLGWTPTCAETEQWIMQMHVDSLPNGGRHQPFYHIVDVDGSRRYVADCNIVPVPGLTDETARALLAACPGVGTELAALSAPAPHGRRRFIPSAQSIAAFPDDDDVAARWVETGETPALDPGPDVSHNDLD